MKKILILIVLFTSVLSLHAAGYEDLIPTPDTVRQGEGFFKIPTRALRVKADETIRNSSRVKEIHLLHTHLKFTVKKDVCLFATSGRSDIILRYDPDSKLGEEGYKLKVTRRQIVLSATTDTGLFNGIQTMIQLFELAEKGQIPCCEIIDYPRLKWRGFMLDSGRQYQSPQLIRQLLYMMARLKMNLFHWHLTDCSGWRIEIKQFPMLTQIGSAVGKGPEQHGFYTQKEIREIVNYAAMLHITVMPEIDVPGHCEAMLTAYPEYSCTGNPPETIDRFSDVILCGGKDSVRIMVKAVLDEVIPLFPGPFFHLGGDEAPKTQWERCPDCQSRIRKHGLRSTHALQIEMMSDLIEYLAIKKKRAVIWNDAVEQDVARLPKSTIIHWWTGRYPEAAEKAGYDILSGLNRYSYLNFPLKPWRGYGKNRTASLKDSYMRHGGYLPGKKAIIGMTCALWTDFNLTSEMLEGRIYPRIFALAEQMWYTGTLCPFEDFVKKIRAQYLLLQKIRIYPGPIFAEEISPQP